MKEPHQPQSLGVDGSPLSLQRSIGAAAGYWEARRIFYNLALGAVVFTWLVSTWPHFRPAFDLLSLARLVILAVLANVCYCAAYLVDIPMQYSALAAGWQRARFALWLAGTLFAILLANYWIADEIYPFVR
jgi:hypothetical protein